MPCFSPKKLQAAYISALNNSVRSMWGNHCVYHSEIWGHLCPQKHWLYLQISSNSGIKWKSWRLSDFFFESSDKRCPAIPFPYICLQFVRPRGTPGADKFHPLWLKGRQVIVFFRFPIIVNGGTQSFVLDRSAWNPERRWKQTGHRVTWK